MYLCMFTCHDDRTYWFSGSAHSARISLLTHGAFYALQNQEHTQNPSGIKLRLGIA